MNSPRQGIKDLPEICAKHGMTHILITPGSRNAPLIIAFTRNKKITALSITDERSAGYFANGIAQVSGNPVGIACTSGTAALNLGPAIAEAYYQNLPILILTADRPREWIDQADGQTIRQYEVFKNHVKQSFEIPVETENEADLWYTNRIVSQALNIANRYPKGPVHINIPLREPLYTPLPEQNNQLKLIETIFPENELAEKDITLLRGKWNLYNRKMVIAGFMKADDSLNKIVGIVAEDEDIVVIAENLSNLHHPKFIYSPERFFASLNDIEKKEYQPELLVTFGNSVVSKKLKQYLRMIKPSEHWHIDPGNEFTDTFQCLNLNIKSLPGKFFNHMIRTAGKSINSGSYSQIFRKKENSVAKIHAEFINRADFSDLKAFGIILENIPANTNLHFTNSTPVRYSQYYPTRHDITYFCNRGTSGIDGCISTAAGSSFYSKKPTTVLSGDLAFIYDSNGLWNKYLEKEFRIIVFNNGGGNIFRLIETSHEISKIQDFFETPHHINLRSLTEAYGLKYYFCNDKMNLNNQLQTFYSEPGPSVLEIKTDAEKNAEVFKKYLINLKEK